MGAAVKLDAKSQAERNAAICRAVKADPHRPNLDIAAEFGVSLSTVTRATKGIRGIVRKPRPRPVNEPAVSRVGEVIRVGDWLHTGDLLVCVSKEAQRARNPRMVTIEKIIYNNDLTRSFILAPTDASNPKLYRTQTSEKTLRQSYRRVNTNEKVVQDA